MSFLIKNDGLLEKYDEIWEEVSSNIKKESDSEAIYNVKCLKIKINLILEKSRQIFTIIKSREKFLKVFVYQ